jgi:alanine racemase
LSYTTTATINLAALLHNVQQVRRFAPNSHIIAMVKANAYGHGLLTVAHALQDQVDALGVARIHEALMLRRAGIHGRIVLMEGFFETWELPLIIQHNLEIVVHQMPQVQALLASHLTKPVPVWLKLDTGMHRLGFSAEEFIAAWHRLHECDAVAPDIMLMSHFAQAEYTSSDKTTQQIACFNEITHDLPGPRSLANSAAIMAYPTSHGDWVRPGIMLYGVSPFADKTAADLQLQPVMTLTSRLLNIRQCHKGDALGYGGTFICPEDMLIGLAAVGYGDGYPRYVPPTGTPILVNGQATQILGRVSMDMICVDLRNIQHPHIGDTVTLWGEGLPVEVIAQAAQTNSYELLCGITSRVEMQVLS